MSVKSSGVAKITGEHFVVHGAWALAVAIGKDGARVELKNPNKDTPHDADSLKISLRDFPVDLSIAAPRLEQLHTTFQTLMEAAKKEQNSAKRKALFEKFAIDNHDIDERTLPYVVIAARLEHEGASILGTTIEVTSQIKPQMGLASSGSCYIAFTVLGVRTAKKDFTSATIIDIARDGERLRHGSVNAGGIDVSTSAEGGYVRFQNASGAVREDVSKKLNLVIIDTGQKPPPGVALAAFSEFKARNPKRYEVLHERASSLTFEMIGALKAEDLKEAGRILSEHQDMFKEAGVSSERLEEGRALAKEHKALGYKSTGSGMGGFAIAVAEDPEELARFMSAKGFRAYVAGVSMEGALKYIEKRDDMPVKSSGVAKITGEHFVV